METIASPSNDKVGGVTHDTFHMEMVVPPSSDRVSLQLQVSSETTKPQSSEACFQCCLSLFSFCDKNTLMETT